MNLLDVLFQHLRRVTEENHRKSQPEYSASVTGLEPRIPPVGRFNPQAQPKAYTHRCNDRNSGERTMVHFCP
jgi:hypothetical protein